MGPTVKCGSCAAEYDAALTQCPYCGELNYNAAEQEYLDRLDDVREDLEDLEDVPAEEVRSETGAQGKRIARIIRRTAIILVVILALHFLTEWWSDRQYQSAYRTEYIREHSGGSASESH